MLGAILGGCLEYLSLAFGYRALLIVAGIVYLLAFVSRPRERAGAPPSVGELSSTDQPAVVG